MQVIIQFGMCSKNIKWNSATKTNPEIGLRRSSVDRQGSSVCRWLGPWKSALSRIMTEQKHRFTDGHCSFNRWWPKERRRSKGRKKKKKKNFILWNCGQRSASVHRSPSLANQRTGSVDRWPYATSKLKRFKMKAIPWGPFTSPKLGPYEPSMLETYALLISKPL